MVDDLRAKPLGEVVQQLNMSLIQDGVIEFEALYMNLAFLK